jgi:hypothetical protein
VTGFGGGSLPQYEDNFVRLERDEPSHNGARAGQTRRTGREIWLEEMRDEKR